MTELPSVGVVVPTHDRPELLALTLRAVLEQDYDGPLEVVVVFDRSEPDLSLERTGTRPVRVVRNTAEPGLPGARNSGIAALDTDLVAFCDDDDVWAAGKLTAQVAALATHDGAPFATCAIAVDYQGRRSVRLAERSTVEHADLLRSRMVMLHSSTFVMRRQWLLDVVGGVAESAPAGQNEDWDLLLRVTRHGSIAHVDEPLVTVRWGTTSFFARQWATRAEALLWMLGRHPDIETDGRGAARVYGQLAFAYAAMGDRSTSRRYAFRAMRSRPAEWRAPVALAVATRAIRPERVLDALHRVGRGV